MADLTLEILNNREKYPDDRIITLGDGEQVTVKEFRDSLQPRAEFTRASEGWRRREQELLGESQRNQQAVEGLQAQLAEAMREKPPVQRDPSQLTEADMLADPVLGPLYKKQQDAIARLEAHEARLQQHEEYVLTREYKGQLEGLATRYNSRYNADGKGKAFDQKAFLDFTIQHKVPDLDVAYRAYVSEDEASHREREAEARGLERGRQTIVPHVPMGRRRGPVKPEGLPESFQDVTEETLANDPEIQAAMDKDLTG